MDSPVRKMQKRNDYNRHKLFRKIRRRRRAQAEQLSHIAEKELKKKLRVTPVKYDDGKIAGYVRDKNDHPIAFDEEGDLVDQVTGEKGIMNIPEVTISPSRYTRDLYSSAFDQNAPVEFINTITAGGLNNLSPTQWVRRAYDTVGLINGDISQGLYIDSWINGNNGIVTDKFAQEHPYWSTGINMAGDVFTFGTPVVMNTAYRKLPWTYKIPENPNMAYRRMGPLERDWLMEGNELSTRATNVLTEAEEEAARTASKKVGRFSLFKAGAEHGGRKQFSKGQPWKGTTVTHGEEQVLAIPGKDLPWVSGRHYSGPQGSGFRVGEVSFEDAPLGSHIDLLTNEGYTGVNPSLLDGSVIYSPFKIFGHNFGYKKIYPKITTPEITAENAASMTDAQWDTAYNAAVNSGDMAEAQRLRDLHFISKAPDTATSVNGQPLQLYHGTNAHFNAFDLSKFGSTDAGTFGKGVYASPSKGYAQLYGKNIMPIYMKLNNPRNLRQSNYADLVAKRHSLGPDFATGNGIDGVVGSFDLEDLGRAEDLRSGFVEYVSHNPKNIKASAAITYDDAGNIIPLSKRDNFNINDIRYGLLPFGMIGAGAYLNQYDDLLSGYKSGKTTSGIHIKPSHRGRLTALKKRTGKSEAELYKTGSAATRKMITFARNARKWNK